MANKIECPKVDGIYCLDHFWNHNAMPEECKKILSKGLAKAYDMFKQGNINNSILVRETSEKRSVISMCPGRHHGSQHGALRLIMITDPRKSTKGLVCLFFPKYHKGNDSEYSDALNKAQEVHDAFKEITFATKKDLDKFESCAAAVAVRPLVVVGFYKIIFEESQEKEKILKAYEKEEKKLNANNLQQKQMEIMYAKAIEELFDWCEILIENKYTTEYSYKEVFRPLFQEFSAKYGKDWEVNIKTILNKKSNSFSQMILDQLIIWENEEGGTCPMLTRDDDRVL